MFINEMYLWLLGTAIIFTVFGYTMSKDKITKDIVELVIDDLIEQGYLKTKDNNTDTDDEVILVKWPND
jgi:hypothetical protein